MLLYGTASVTKTFTLKGVQNNDLAHKADNFTAIYEPIV
jgi:hypothetical protein